MASEIHQTAIHMATAATRWASGGMVCGVGRSKTIKNAAGPAKYPIRGRRDDIPRSFFQDQTETY
jgi:orotidine-5'-phosphate decarboxylase